MNKNFPNIYTVLDEIQFEEQCKRAEALIKNGHFLPDQFIFSIVQKFYENILNRFDNVKSESDIKKMIITQLDHWMKGCEEQVDAFDKVNMLTSKISSQAMSQAYWNVKQFIDVNLDKKEE